MKIIRQLTLAAIAAFSMTHLTACNTVEGAGKDIKAGGTAIEREAKDANK